MKLVEMNKSGKAIDQNWWSVDIDISERTKVKIRHENGLIWTTSLLRSYNRRHVRYTEQVSRYCGLRPSHACIEDTYVGIGDLRDGQGSIFITQPIPSNL